MWTNYILLELFDTRQLLKKMIIFTVAGIRCVNLCYLFAPNAREPWAKMTQRNRVNGINKRGKGGNATHSRYSYLEHFNFLARYFISWPVNFCQAGGCLYFFAYYFQKVLKLRKTVTPRLCGRLAGFFFLFRVRLCDFIIAWIFLFATTRTHTFRIFI